MSLCIVADPQEQIEIALPDGKKIIVLVLAKEGRSMRNIKLAFVAPKEIAIIRCPRKSKDDNHKS